MELLFQWAGSQPTFVERGVLKNEEILNVRLADEKFHKIN